MRNYLIEAAAAAAAYYISIMKADNKGHASGFDTDLDQEAENTICTHPSSACTVEGNATSSSG